MTGQGNRLFAAATSTLAWTIEPRQHAGAVLTFGTSGVEHNCVQVRAIFIHGGVVLLRLAVSLIVPGLQLFGAALVALLEMLGVHRQK